MESNSFIFDPRQGQFLSTALDVDQKDSYVSGERQSILDVLMLKDTFFFSNVARCILQVDVVSQIIPAVLQFAKKLYDTAQIEN